MDPQELAARFHKGMTQAEPRDVLMTNKSGQVASVPASLVEEYKKLGATRTAEPPSLSVPDPYRNLPQGLSGPFTEAAAAGQAPAAPPPIDAQAIKRAQLQALARQQLQRMQKQPALSNDQAAAQLASMQKGVQASARGQYGMPSTRTAETSLEKVGPYDTPLGDKTLLGNQADAAKYALWKSRVSPYDSGEDYDLQGQYKRPLDASSGYGNDTYKKPNHPSFSRDSQYAVGDQAQHAGYWTGKAGEHFMLPPQPTENQLRFMKEGDEGHYPGGVLMYGPLSGRSQAAQAEAMKLQGGLDQANAGVQGLKAAPPAAEPATIVPQPKPIVPPSPPAPRSHTEDVVRKMLGV